MKNLMIALGLVFLGGCGMINSGTVVPAQTGVVLCSQLGALPFQGGVTLHDGWAVVTPQDRAMKKVVVPSTCVIAVLEEADEATSETPRHP